MSDDELTWAPVAGHGDEVLYAVDGPLGRVRLNRPRAINALDRPSVDALRQQLTAWAQDDSVAAVVLDGAGGRGLCAGGDVRVLREMVSAGRHEEAEAFWAAEYVVNGLISAYPKPYVAWMDGIVMGGGVGVSAHGSLRVVTERTQLAMPETVIGFFPDVGGLWFLSHAPGELGTHTALTGLPVTGADAIVLGMADVLVPSSAKGRVLAALREDPALDGPALAGLVDGAQVRAGQEDSGRIGSGQVGSGRAGSWLEEQRGWIDECYAGDDAAVIVERLLGHPSPEARAAGETIATRSPFSVAVTLEGLRRAASMDVPEVLAQDVVLGRTFDRHPDFAEGVRAQVVDKDRSPRWTHASVAEVPRSEVLAAFGAG